MVLEKTLESPLDSKKIKLVNPKGHQCWIFIGRTDAEALILCPPDAKNWLIGKDPDAGKDRTQEKGWERVRWSYGITDLMDVSLSKFCALVMDREAWHGAVHGTAKTWTTEQRNWTVPIPIGHHRTLSWAPYAIQQLPTIYFTHGSIYMSISVSQFIPAPLPLFMLTCPFSMSASLFLPCK